jgi:hypothetical protein
MLRTEASMGFRTVVILNNDRHDDWAKDPALGQKISAAMNYTHRKTGENDFGTGRVVQCCHADEQTIAVIDNFDVDAITATTWQRGEDKDSVRLKLVKMAADALGFRLVKKSNPRGV